MKGTVVLRRMLLHRSRMMMDLGKRRQQKYLHEILQLFFQWQSQSDHAPRRPCGGAVFPCMEEEGGDGEAQENEEGTADVTRHS